MKNRVKKFGLITALLILGQITASAGAMIKEHIPGDAKWLVHFDMDSLKNSQLGAFLQSSTNTEKMEKKLANIEAMFGFDPWRDLNGIVMYGADASKDGGSTLVYGTFDKARLMSVLRENEGFDETEYAGHEIYRGIRPYRGHRKKTTQNTTGRQGWCAFHSQNLVVLGKTVDSVKTALDVLDGRKTSIARDGNFLTTTDKVPDSFLFIKADLAGLDIAPHAVILKATDSIEMTVGEQSGSLTGRLLMQIEDEQKAANVRTIAEGMLAGGALSAERNPVIGLLADSVTISSVGATVEMELFCPVDSVKAAVLEKINDRLKKGF